jgi:hypothetical protein
MKIDSKAGQVPASVRAPVPASRDEAAVRPSADAVTAAPAEPRRDSVQISDAARRLAGDAERLAEIRTRIQEGFYTTPEVLDVVAERMLASGDL